MGRVDRAPAGVDRGVAEQPLHRRGPAPRQTRPHLGNLLGDVDVDGGGGIGRVQRDNRVGQVAGGHRAQRVKRQADAAVAVPCDRLPERNAVTEDLVDGCDEPALFLERRVRPEVGDPVERGQERQPDPGGRGGFVELQGHLVRHGVGPPLGVVAQVVKLGHRRVAVPQHLGVELGGHDLHISRRKLREKRVHPLPPAAKPVLGRAAAFDESRHRPLKCVGVQVGDAGNDGAGDASCPFRVSARKNLREIAVYGHFDAHIARPAAGKQRLIEMEGGHDALRGEHALQHLEDFGHRRRR